MGVAKLIVEYDYDFDVYAIISPVKDYKLAWCINSQLSFEFEKQQDVLLEYNNGAKMYFSSFSYETEYNCYRLLKNKSCEYSNISKPYLLSELKDYDYILVVDGEGEREGLTEYLKSVNNIIYIKQFNPENLKSRENLIY